MVDVTKLSRRRNATLPLATSSITLPLSQSIDGTESERRYFFNYIRFTETADLHHTCNTQQVWARFIPQLGHHHEVVKHSMVAFGAAFQRFKLGITKDASTSPFTDAINELEAFTTRQYCKALNEVSQLPVQGDVECTKLALACCLNFVCIESLRVNHHTALWHLNNGVRIIEASMGRGELEGNDKSMAEKGALHTLDTDLRDLIQQFYDYRICLQGLDPKAPLLLKNPGHCLQPEGVASLPFIFHTVPDGHDARIRLARSVMSFYGNLEVFGAEKLPGEQEIFDQRLTNLRQQALWADHAFETFLDSPQAPPCTSPARYVSYIDFIHVIRITGALDLMAVGAVMHESVAYSGPFQARFIERLVRYGEAAHAFFTASGAQRAGFALETCIVSPLRWAYDNAAEAKVKGRALRILQETEANFGPPNGYTRNGVLL
ncbi:hypothetical protein NQ176_g4447 [Zarea fungicola]|uniref:Uncharacterized protein n=1 Tax=Zarea fungicola TaxID=93591 RepID=A0ACC1NEA7_9HYPO|nr:hypothetical protein NQ176_g4447 [Lecanicillium fungicola]